MVSRVLRVHLGGKVIEVTTDWTVFPVVLDRKVNRDETGQWVFQACEDLLVHPGVGKVRRVHRGRKGLEVFRGRPGLVAPTDTQAIQVPEVP